MGKDGPGFMIQLGLAAFAAIAFTSLACRGQAKLDPLLPYSAAFLKGDLLTIFLVNSELVEKRLAMGVGRFTYGPDGTGLYGEGIVEGVPSLVRIDLATGKARQLQYSGELRNANSMAVSPDEAAVLIAGTRTADGAVECGIFLYSIETATIRRVLRASDQSCKYSGSWRDLSFSPDAKFAVAVREGIVELIDVEHGSLRPIAAGIGVAWSPDGKWIAVAEDGAAIRIRLLGARDFKASEVIGVADKASISWSPDSRYVLTWRSRLLCGSGYFGTLYALDVRSHLAIPVPASNCRVNLNTDGWVSNTVFSTR